MTVPILGSDDKLIHPQDIAVVFSDTDGNCVWVETTPQERLAIVRKLASNRQWHSKNYKTQEVTLFDLATPTESAPSYPAKPTPGTPTP